MIFATFASHMRPTVDYIQQRFDRYNLLMFGGRLPRIPIRLSDAKSFLGQCVSQIRVHPDGRREHYGFELRISTRFDLPETTVDDTIIHEMIHYFIHYNGLADTSAHGPIFKSIMHSINTVHGRNLSVSHRSTADQQEQANARPRWHVIAVLHLCSSSPGTVGIKVLPRTTERIIEFHRRALSSPQVSGIDLYLHNAPYFNRYPTSAALRYHLVPLADITPHLTSARPITIHGNTLTY